MTVTKNVIDFSNTFAKKKFAKVADVEITYDLALEGRVQMTKAKI